MKFIVLLAVLFSLQSFAQVSPSRNPNVDYRDVANSRLMLRKFNAPFAIRGGAYDERASSVNAMSVAEWTQGDIKKAFKEIRDERFMKDENDFSRRPTWLYPYDGCYARAELATQRLEQKGFAKPSKIFIFGNLEVHSKNASETVSWWYHVAVAYRYQGQVYIFDPAMNPYDVTPLEKWSNMMGPDEKEYSICSDATYDPDSQCNGAIQIPFETAKNHQSSFFESERQNILDLGRNPDEELADKAPWMSGGLSLKLLSHLQ